MTTPAWKQGEGMKRMMTMQRRISTSWAGPLLAAAGGLAVAVAPAAGSRDAPCYVVSEIVALADCYTTPFALTDDGTLCGTFDCPPAFEGYPGQLQGGVVAALLDGTMANWLFANHIVAVTAELTTRFRHPVRTHQPAEIRAQLVRADRGLYLLKATLSQEGQCRADARGKFLVPPPNKTPSHGKPNGVS